MSKLLNRYKNVEKNVLYMIGSEASLQIVNGAFILILGIYLKNKGFTDSENALFVRYRFLSSMLLAAPLGMLIKGKRLIPLFKWAALITPILSVITIYSIETNDNFIISLLMFLWGFSFTITQVCKLPFIMRNSSPNNLTSAITLNYATWSFGAIVAGIVVTILTGINLDFFNEKILLYIITSMSFISLFFAFKIKTEKVIKSDEKTFSIEALKAYDWKIIIKSLVPTFILATGAGLSIPFMNLFFNHVHGFSSADFSKLGSLTFFLVFLMILFVPSIKDKFGYKTAIPVTQGSAILILIVLALTEFYSEYYWAFIIASLCFILRQPIMNTAQPMTTDLVMKYVGKNNQELVSAIYSTIWNGTFVISSFIFGTLRDIQTPYAYIFFVTAILYIIGLILYILLILDFEKREKLQTQ